MFLRAGLRFPCFPLVSLFLAPQRCQGAPLLGTGVFVFPESGAPTGGSSPGQLQMRNSWPAALAAAQIRPFEKITVLLLPPPPVGHARSAEGRGMCRRAGGGRMRAGRRGRAGGWGHRGATFHSTSFRKFFSLLFFSLSSLKCFNFCSTEQAVDCSQIKPDRVFPLSQEQRGTVQFSHLPPLVVFWLLVFVS